MRQERCRARPPTSSSITATRGSQMGWLPAPRRKICHFGVNPDPTGRFKAASPRTETFSRGQDPLRRARSSAANGAARARLQSHARDEPHRYQAAHRSDANVTLYHLARAPPPPRILQNHRKMPEGRILRSTQENTPTYQQLTRLRPARPSLRCFHASKTRSRHRTRGRTADAATRYQSKLIG